MALIIFDLDGTLLNSIEGLGVATNMALKDFDFPTHPIEAYKHFVGNGIRMTVERALPDDAMDQVEEVLAAMISYYKVHYVDGLVAYEGVYELLDTLVAEGHKIAMVTNKYQFMADVIMPEYFADYPFVSTIGRNEAHPAKPDPTTILNIIKEQNADPLDTFMVGDTEVDIEVARNADIIEVFVSWGFRKPEELANWQPRHVIDRPMELLEVINISKKEELL